LFGALEAPVQRVGAAYCAVPFSKPLETAFVPSQAQIETAVRKALG
jgi:pyruvate dehydrogenase E1 component beta subunit